VPDRAERAGVSADAVTGPWTADNGSPYASHFSDGYNSTFPHRQPCADLLWPLAPFGNVLCSARLSRFCQ
jgi:hypothetical protein